MACDIMTYASPKTPYVYYTTPIRGLTPENKAHLLVAIKPTCSHANVRIVRLRTYGVRSRKAPYAGRLGAAASSPSASGAALAMMSFTFRPFSFLPLSSASVPPLVMTAAYAAASNALDAVQIFEVR